MALAGVGYFEIKLFRSKSWALNTIVIVPPGNAQVKKAVLHFFKTIYTERVLGSLEFIKTFLDRSSA